MPFCPSCGSEFRKGSSRCSECDVELVAALPAEGDAAYGGERYDVFVCFSSTDASRALSLLGENGIEALVRDRASSAFPVNVGTEAMKLIAVRAEDFDAAAAALRQAIEDEVLPPDGQVIERPH